MEIKLGDTVKDRLTGLEGVVYGISYWLNSNTTIGIVPNYHKDGKPAETSWFDEGRLVVIQSKKKK